MFPPKFVFYGRGKWDGRCQDTLKKHFNELVLIIRSCIQNTLKHLR